MAPTKGKKRAYSHVSLEDSGLDDFGVDDGGSVQPVSRTTQKKGRSDDWASWQEGVRTQEADRAQQYVRTFQSDIVAAARDKAMATLRRGEDARAKENAKSRERVREAYGPVEPSGSSLVATEHPLYKAGIEVLALFHSTIARYEQANAALEELRSSRSAANSIGSLQSSWPKDRAEGHKLLSYGRTYGDSLVHEIIVPKNAGSPHQASESSSDLEKNLNQTGRSALGMFPRSRATVARGQTWGDAARSQMRALTGLLKTLPGGSVGSSESGRPTVTKTVSFDC